jgi:hypothetical protein
MSSSRAQRVNVVLSNTKKSVTVFYGEVYFEQYNLRTKLYDIISSYFKQGVTIRTACAGNYIHSLYFAILWTPLNNSQSNFK